MVKLDGCSWPLSKLLQVDVKRFVGTPFFSYSFESDCIHDVRVFAQCDGVPCLCQHSEIKNIEDDT